MSRPRKITPSREAGRYMRSSTCVGLGELGVEQGGAHGGAAGAQLPVDLGVLIARPGA